jgi:hypothetical protein
MGCPMSVRFARAMNLSSDSPPLTKIGGDPAGSSMGTQSVQFLDHDGVGAAGSNRYR